MSALLALLPLLALLTSRDLSPFEGQTVWTSFRLRRSRPPRTRIASVLASTARARGAARCRVEKLKLCIPLTVPVERVSTTDKRGSVTRELGATAGQPRPGPRPARPGRAARRAGWHRRRAPRGAPRCQRGLGEGLHRGPGLPSSDAAEHSGRCSAAVAGVVATRRRARARSKTFQNQ